MGSALFDLALNPRSRLFAGSKSTGSVMGAAASSDEGAECRSWFESNAQSVQIPARDGGALFGWLLSDRGLRASADGRVLVASDGSSCSPQGGAYAILCHGYRGRPSDLATQARISLSYGVDAIVPAARGHERNDGRYISMGWHDSSDLLGWIDLIRAFDPAARIALYGISMGGAEVMMASGLQLPSNVRCIIEDCGFTSVWDEFSVQIESQLGLPPVPLLTMASAVCRARAGFGFKEASAVRRLGSARVPMLFIHGSGDEFVPFWMLDSLFDACSSPIKERLVVEGAGHCLASTRDPERYWSAIGAFAQRHLFG